MSENYVRCRKPLSIYGRRELPAVQIVGLSAWYDPRIGQEPGAKRHRTHAAALGRVRAEAVGAAIWGTMR